MKNLSTLNVNTLSNTTFQTSLPSFTGPLDLLLNLISSEKLDINTVSLAKITDQYLNYISTTNISPDETSDFLLIASKLILIKAKTLLPTMNNDLNQEDEINLEQQLKIYKEYLKAMDYIKTLISKQQIGFAKEKMYIPLENKVYPDPNISKSQLKTIMENIISKRALTIIKPQVLENTYISLRERIKQLNDIVCKEIKVCFSALTVSTASKIEIIINFLAILELFKRNVIIINQKNTFDEIEIEHMPK